MRQNNQNVLINLIKRNGYRAITTIDKDEFERYHGIISDIQGNKFFVKAVSGESSYRYKSLFAECEVSSYLSSLTESDLLLYNGYRLKIPKVEKIIKEGEILILISDYIKGRRLLDESSQFQAEMLITVLELVTKLSGHTRRFQIQPYLKDYSRNTLLVYLPLRLMKAVFLSPFAAFKIIMTVPKVLPLFQLQIYDNGLVHADINASNILINKKTVYLTDWEEAGWGISAYNIISPLCVHWQDRIIRNRLLRSLHDEGLKKAIIPLLSYRTLTLLNQKVSRKNIKRMRDLKLLNFDPASDIRILPIGINGKFSAVKGDKKI